MADQSQSPKPNPSAPEIYADRASSVTLRGNVARITFVSDRVDADPQAAAPVVAGHTAMSVRGFVQLYAQMQSVVQQMEDKGLLRRPDQSGNTAAAKPTKSPAKKPATRAKPKSAGAAKTPRKRSSTAKK